MFSAATALAQMLRLGTASPAGTMAALAVSFEMLARTMTPNQQPSPERDSTITFCRNFHPPKSHLHHRAPRHL
jgi:hypothetical protein